MTTRTHLEALRFVLSFRSPTVLILLMCLVVGVPHHALAAVWTSGFAPVDANNYVGLAESSDGQTIITGGGSGAALYSILRTTDGGAHWTEVLTGAGSGNYPWTSFAMSSDGETMAGVQDGGYIWVSTDGGDGWSQTGPGNATWKSISMTAGGGYMIAVPGGQPYLSYDGGSSWLHATGGLGNAGYLRADAWDTAAYSPDGNYLLVGDTGGFGYLATSTDQGAHWTTGVEPISDDWYTVAAANDGTMVAGGPANLYISHDGGSNWSTAITQSTENWTTTSISGDGDTLLAGNDGGYIWLSTNGGGVWSEQSSPGSHLWTGSAVDADGGYAAAVAGSYLYTFDADASSITVPGVPPELRAYSRSAPNTMSLSWTAPESDGGSAITDYLLEYKLHTDDIWTPWNHTPTPDTSAIITGLNGDVLYDFRVTAENDIGFGDPSDILSVPPSSRHHSGSYVGGNGTNIIPSGTSTIGTTTPPVLPTSVRDLTLGMTGDDVNALQLLLIAAQTGPHASALATHGATHYFGPLTQAALAEYQAAHAITPAVGYFGPLTRAQMKTAGLNGIWW